MNCPICQFTNLKGDEITCPNCNSDLQFLNQIRITSESVRKERLLIILISIALLLSVASTIFLYVKARSIIDAAYGEIIQLRADNAAMRNTISELNLKLSNTTLLQVDNKDLEEKDTKISIKPEGATEYIVLEGDNLWKIAIKFYGDGFKFSKIETDNKIADPSVIVVGTTLIINKNN